jgi:hypothetical protein
MAITWKQFSRILGHKVPENVVAHSYDKLLRLVPEGYIVNKNKEIIKRHNIIVDYVNKHDPNKKTEYLL